MAIQPPQRFELDDLTHVKREARTIYAPGATPGDALVVQSDHSLIAAPGGGSLPAGAVNVFPFANAGAADDAKGSNGDLALLLDTGTFVQKAGGTWATS